MTVGDVCAWIEEWAPPGLAYEWDNPGLALGAPENEVCGALVVLTATRLAFERALACGANLIVAHHPPIFHPILSLREDHPSVRLLLDMARAGMSCYAAHTNLDVAPGGVSQALARQVGLRDIAPLLPARHAGMVKLVTFVPESHVAIVREAVCAAGAGVIGAYTHCTFSAPGTGTFAPGDDANPFSGVKGALNEEPERRFETLAPHAILDRVIGALKRSHPYEEVAFDIVPLENRDTKTGLGARGTLAEAMPLNAFAAHLCRALDVSHVRVMGSPKTLVQQVGVIGGSGADAIREVAGKVDALVTGDVKYHDALLAQELGLAVVDAGHEGSERCILEALADYLKRRAPSLPVDIYREPETFRIVGA